MALLWGASAATVDARQMVVTSSATDFTLQVGDGTNLADFKLNFTESLGAGIDEWKDVNSESSPTGFGPELTYTGATCQYRALFNLNLGKSGTGNDLTDICSTSGARLIAQEISPVRTILYGTSPLTPWNGGTASTSWSIGTKYTVYANGRIYGTRTVAKQSEPMNASTWHYPMRLFTRYDAAYPYGFMGGDENRGSMATATTGEFAADASADYWGFQATTTDWVGDAALGFYSDWALADSMNNNRFSVTLYNRMGPKDATSRQWNAGTVDTFNYMALLKPNNLNDHGSARPYYQEYRYPDRPTVATGTAESGSLGDSDSDGWNEEEGAYEVRAAGHKAGLTLHGNANASTTINTGECFPGDTSITVASTAGFDSSGYAYLANGRDIFSYTSKDATNFIGVPGVGTYAIASCDNGDRVTAHSLYDPVIKLHEFYPKTGTTLATRTVQHLRLDDNAANATVAAAVGTAGLASGNTSGLTTSTAKRVSGFTLDDDGEYVSSTTGDLADWGQGTIELWYRPNYAFNQGSAPVKYIFGTGASGVSGNVYLKHEDSGSGYNRLRFGLYDEDGSPVEHTVEVRSSDYADLWNAYEWVHLRVTWDENAATDNLKIYVNGQYLTQYNVGEAAWTAFTPPYTIFWGDYQASGVDNGEGGFDDVYIHNDVVAGHLGAPVVLESLYNTGTVTTAAGSSTVTGAGTSWLSNLTAGQAIRIMADGDEQWYEIASVDVDTSLTLTRPYRGTGGSGKSYEAGGTPIALPQLKVASTAKVLDTDYNVATAGPVSSYVSQYLGTVGSNQLFEFGTDLSTSTLTQSRYRFYDNANALTPTDPWPVGDSIDTAENTAVATSSGPADSSVLRLRLAVQVGALDLAAGTQAFRLQYAEGWVCSAISAWSDVGDAASTTAPWRGYGNAGVSDGAALTTKVLSTADVAGSYEEENNSAQNPYAVGIGQEVEFDWVLHARDIAADSSYCFRMVKSGGGALDSYSQYPRVSTTSTAPSSATLTQSRYRLYANADAVNPSDPWPVGGTNLAENTAATADDGPLSGNVLRLRMGITVGAAQLDAAAQAFKLQFGTGGTCSAVSNWQDLPDGTSTTAPWRGYNNATPADGATISSLLLSTATVGGSYEESNDSVANPNAIAATGVGEWDWAVEANALAEETSYCFRMVKASGDALDTYSVYPQLTTTSTTFDVTYEGGNGQDFSRTGNSVSFNGELDIGAGADKRTTWFDFSMNFAKAKSVSFSMGNARGSNTETLVWTGKRPMYSYDRVTWTPVSADGSGGASLDDPFLWTAPGGTATFTADTVYIAYNVPYTYTDAQNDITRWQATGYVSSTSVIGQSVQGRDMHLLTFNDVNSPVREYQKKVLWITGRQHGMESLANYHLRGAVDFYTNTSTPESLAFRRNWILKIIPDANPDAMYHGWTRSNANGEDLNREWATGGPNVSEEIEVNNMHTAMQNWENAGGAFTAYFDAHTKSSADPGAYYADTSFDSQVFYDNLVHLANSLSVAAFSGGSYAIDTVRADYGPPSWTIEGPDVRWDASNHPSIANGTAWGRAWAMAAVTTYTPSTTAKVFAFHEVPESTGASTKTLVTAPGKFHLVFDDAKGGALTYWYDIENQTTHGAQLGDTTYGVDRLEWHDGTAVRALASSTNVTTTVAETNGAFVKLVTTGRLGGVTGLDYTLTRFIGEDGRIFSTFELVNGTGGAVDWGTMTQFLSVNNTNFNFGYDNTDATPTPGTDRWIAQVGTSAGSPAIKAVAAAHFVTSSASLAYDTYGSQTGTPRWNYYRDADGPSQSNGATVTTTWAFQLNPDNDANGSEGQLDAYSDDLTHFDSPTASVGTYLGVATTSGAMLFAASGNEAKFTYTNAVAFPKKRPIFVLTGYTATTAPVLKVAGSFLDGEDGSAHSTSTHVSSTYTSHVSTTLQTAYVQYLGDISSNSEVQIDSVITGGGSAPTAPSGAAATYNSDTQITLAWTDASSDEDGFPVERRTDTGAGYGSWTGIATTSANATSYADTSVVANRKYQYRVRAYNATGYSAFSTDGSDVYTTPSAPSQPSGSPDSVSAITWTWTDNAAFESSYRFGLTSGGTTYAAGLSADLATYQVTSLATNTAYAGQAAVFRADRGVVSSTASTAVYTLSAIPISLAVDDDSTTQITATWGANGNPAGTEYYVENTTASTNSGWITDTSWASTGLTCGTSYTFHVRSRNAAGTATSYTGNAATSTAACPTAPTAPSAAAATYNSDSQITLDWTDNSSNEDSFVVERRTDTGAGYGSYAVVATTSAGAVSYADTSVAANRKYQYRVRAYNVAGYSAYSTDGSDVFTTPAAPSTPSGAADSTSAITWTWTDNAAFESSYRFGLTVGGTDYVSGQAADLAAYQVTGLSVNVGYRGQAAAFRADRGVASSTASALVYTLANVPSSLAAAEDSGTQITATWNANGNPGGTEYYVENVTAGANSGWTTATTWASTGLTCSTPYDFRVRARNGDAVATAFTATVTATTTSSCPAPAPSGGTGAPAVIPPVSGGGQGNVDPNVGGAVSRAIPASSGSAQVVFPGGALPGTAVVSVVPQLPATVAAQAPLPAGALLAAGMAAQINVSQGVFPVTTVNVPVTIRFTYTDQALAGVDEGSLAIHRYDQETRRWLRLSDSRVDRAMNVVSATTNHFSLFAVLAGGSAAPQPVGARLIKQAGDSRVWVVTPTGYRRHIPTEAAFLSYGYRWVDVATVSATALAAYPVTTVIKVAGDARVWAVEAGRRSWIPDEATFLSRGYAWAAVSVVSSAELESYPQASASAAAAGTFRSFLTVGSTGAEVRLLQQKLRAAGYFTYPSDTGRYGAATRDAVVRFQRARGIDPVGYVGPATRAALNTLP